MGHSDSQTTVCNLLSVREQSASILGTLPMCARLRCKTMSSLKKLMEGEQERVAGTVQGVVGAGL